MTTRSVTRPSDQTWFYVVLLFVGLNAVDLGMTLRLVDLGSTELNPIMDSVLGAGPVWAIAFKGAITFGVAAGLWFGRHHLIVRRAGIAFVGAFAVLAAYELINMAAI